jgi:hypothetical protein
MQSNSKCFLNWKAPENNKNKKAIKLRDNYIQGD